MSEIDRFRPEDRRGVEMLYRRMQGADAADATRLRWDWQHRRNPYNASGQPEIWVAREGRRPVRDASRSRVVERPGGGWRLGR
jgi:hypothetical protein